MSDAKKMLKELAYTHLEPMDEQGRELVAVVRCKDCKHLMFSDFYGECRKGYLGIVKPDDYCSYGERKDE